MAPIGVGMAPIGVGRAPSGVGACALSLDVSTLGTAGPGRSPAVAAAAGVVAVAWPLGSRPHRCPGWSKSCCWC
eukprot:359034-Chlamydomonas_euryale.AAC.5